MTEVHTLGIVLLVLSAILATVLVVDGVLSWHDWRVSRPRLRSRTLPSLTGQRAQPGAATSWASGPSLVTVAGRTYRVMDGDAAGPAEVCPWCLGSLDGADPAGIVRCERPFCRQAAHRRHNDEQGGCGGVCAVVST